MKSGFYRCRMERCGGFDVQDILIRVEDRPKSYLFTMIEDKSRFKSGYIEMLFKDGKSVVISKIKPSQHALRDWGDNSFTIYPFQGGTPYYFELRGS